MDVQMVIEVLGLGQIDWGPTALLVSIAVGVVIVVWGLWYLLASRGMASCGWVVMGTGGEGRSVEGEG